MYELDEAALRNLIDEHPEAVGRIHRKNYYSSDGSEMVSHELINRLFPKNLYHYEGTIHEQVVPAGETYEVPLFISHVGYKLDSVNKKEKAERNLWNRRRIRENYGSDS